MFFRRLYFFFRHKFQIAMIVVRNLVSLNSFSSNVTKNKIHSPSSLLSSIFFHKNKTAIIKLEKKFFFCIFRSSNYIPTDVVDFHLNIYLPSPSPLQIISWKGRVQVTTSIMKLYKEKWQLINGTLTYVFFYILFYSDDNALIQKIISFSLISNNIKFHPYGKI